MLAINHSLQKKYRLLLLILVFCLPAYAQKGDNQLPEFIIPIQKFNYPEFKHKDFPNKIAQSYEFLDKLIQNFNRDRFFANFAYDSYNAASINDTVRELIRSIYLVKDYNPIIFKQYENYSHSASEVNIFNYEQYANSVFLSNFAVVDKSFHDNENFVHIISKDIGYEINRLSAEIEYPDLYKDIQFINNSDYILRLKIINLKQFTNYGAPFFMAEAEVQDILKGNPQSITNKANNTIKFIYLNSCEYLNQFDKNNGTGSDALKLSKGSEIVAVLSLRNYSWDNYNDYFFCFLSDAFNIKNNTINEFVNYESGWKHYKYNEWKEKINSYISLLINKKF